MTSRPAAIASRFLLAGDLVSVSVIETGLINSTYQAVCRSAEGATVRYVLQAINDRVFRDPLAVMRNVGQVIRHCRAKSPSARALALVPARDGAMWATDDGGTLWRCYEFLEGCVTYDVIRTVHQAREVARAFGAFHALVSDLDPALLTETIPDFHDTRKRFDRLMEVVREDPAGRRGAAGPQLEFIAAREALADALMEPLARGEIPLRVVHNDTKVNNVMIDAATDDAVCVIDLDTVMPGLALCDFGDLVRSACSLAGEEGADLSAVGFRLPIFEALVDGYLETAGAFLTPRESGLLVTACRVLTFELAIRFLTDHLEGDVYFKIRAPGHNLVRCRNQLQLLECMERVAPEMERIVAAGAGG